MYKKYIIPPPRAVGSGIGRTAGTGGGGTIFFCTYLYFFEILYIFKVFVICFIIFLMYFYNIQ